MNKSYFAGGCFWCMEPAFRNLEGVSDVVVGYHGPQTDDGVEYAKVATGTTDYVEAVEITYNSEKTSYEKILEVFWKSIDPTDAGGQFHDRGKQYQTAIFYQNPQEQKIAEKSKTDLGNSGKFSKQIATSILPFDHFYPAEDYHQNYYQKNSEHYNRYTEASGRKDFLAKIWSNDKK